MYCGEERFMLNGSGFPSVVANPVIIAIIPTFNVNRGIIDTNRQSLQFPRSLLPVEKCAIDLICKSGFHFQHAMSIPGLLTIKRQTSAIFKVTFTWDEEFLWTLSVKVAFIQ